MANDDSHDLTTFITTYVCRACKQFSSSNIKSIRSHCFGTRYCREKNNRLKEASVSSDFSPWTQVTTRIHASNREVGGQQVVQRHQSVSIAQGGSDGAAGAAAAANYADKMLPEVLPDTGKKYVF
jgi:hypothetical protein